MKPRSQRRQTALLKIRVDAADAEYVQVIGHWQHLFGGHRPRITFDPSQASGRFKTEVEGAQKMRKGESYLIVDAISGTFVGIVRGVRAVSIEGRLPQAGRLYHLILMGRT